MVYLSQEFPRLQLGLFTHDQQLISQIFAIVPNTILLTVEDTLPADIDIVLIDDSHPKAQTFIGDVVNREIPSILITDLSNRSLDDALEAGITDYITKPISQKVLQHRLQSFAPHYDHSTEYQSILSSMSDPIFVFDINGTYLKIPSISTGKYYLPPEKLLGKSIHDVFPEEIANQFQSYIKRAVDTQTTQNLSYDLLINNERVYFSAVINPIKGRQEVVWVARDITRNKLNEISMAETERQYRQLFENANDMLLMVELETGKIIDANKQTQKQLGYTYDEITQLHISEIEEPLQDSKSRIVNRTLVSTGHIIFEQNYIKKDGSTIPVEISTRLVKQNNSQVLLSFARNIKQRKLAMQAEAEERYFSEVLRETVSKIAHTQSVDIILDIIINTVTKVIDGESANVMLIEGDTATVVRQKGYRDTDSQPNQVSIKALYTLQYMYENHRGVVISDTSEDTRWIKFSDKSWPKSYVGAPITLKDEIIGFINLDSSKPHTFTNKHRQRLQVFANQVAIAIENARLYEASQRYTEELETRVRQRTNELTEINISLNQQIKRREQAEAKLAEERNLLRTIINSLPVMVYVKNRQSQYTLANQFPYLTIKNQPIIGKSDLDLLKNKENALKNYHEEQQVMNNRETHVREEYIISYKGEENWRIITKVPLIDENDEVIGLVGVNQDITKIKLAERQIRQLLSSANCLLWSAIVEQVDGEYQWNIHIENEENATDFLPFDTDQYESYTEAWLNSIPAEDSTLRQTVATTYLQHNQQNYKVEYRCITSDEKEHWLNEDVQIRKMTGNRWQLVGVSLDISDIKFAEFALREAFEQMEQRVHDRTNELQNANNELQQEIITRQQAEESERRQRILAEALQKSLTTIVNSLNIDDVLDAVLDGIQQNLHFEAANIMLFEGNVIKVVRQRGYVKSIPELIPLDAFEDVKRLIDSKEPAIIPDTRKYDLWAGIGEVDWIRCNVKIPIIQDNQVIGIINLDSSQPEQYTLEDAKSLKAFADQASIALQNAKLYQQAQDEINERKRAEAAERKQRIFAETIRDTAIALNQNLNIDDIFDTILNVVSQIVDVHDTCSIIMVDNDDMIGTVVKDVGFEKFGGSNVGLQIDLKTNHDKIASYSYHKPIIIADTKQSPLWIDIKQTRWIRSSLAVPIHTQDKLLATINLDSQYPNTFNDEHINQLTVFSHQVAIALQNAQLIEQIQEYAQELEARVKERTLELEQERSLLQFERSQLRAILNAMRDGVYFTDTKHNAIYINNALTQLTGYTEEQWLSGEVFPLINKSVDIDREKLWNTIERQLDIYPFTQNEDVLTRADGSVFNASLTRTEVKDIDNNRVGIVSVVRDISYEKQLEEQKSRFIANAAHELRTPITNIKTRLFLMKHKPENITEHLRIVESSANWLQTLVDNLFDHSRFERGIIELNLEYIRLQEIANSIIETQRMEAEKKNIQIIHKWDATPIILHADESRLRQVITNLVNNAIAYTPDNGTITVIVGQQNIDDVPHAIIKVSDTGTGIEEKHLPYLFQPFYRVATDNKGTGLGLSISQEIVEAHHGTISVDSIVNEGTTFKITLPLSLPVNNP